MPPLAIAGLAAAGGLAGALGSKKTVGMQQGVAIDPNAFKIPDADKYREDARNQYNSAIQRGQFTLPKQQQFLGTLEQAANGQGPSLAVEQLKQAQNRTLAQQMAAAQAARNGNPALAQRQLAQQAMQAQAQNAAASTQARIQEQQNARQQYGQQLNTMQGAADQLTQQYLNQGFSIAQAQQQAAADFQRLSVQQALGLAPTNAALDLSNSQSRADMFKNISGGMMQGLSMGLGSDENIKTDIKKADKEVKSFLDALSEQSFKYKEPNQPHTAPGKRFGIMAQDLEKSEAGKSIVYDTPHGKIIDVKQGLGLAFAAQANLNKRLKELENKNG